MLEFLSLREGSEAAELPVVTLESFSGQSNATAVRIEPGEDARELLPYLDRIALVEVNFPVFGDGRGYSAARILREAGYQGELRAVGDVAVDQLRHMVRCGFDAFSPDKPLDPAQVEKSIGAYPGAYQRTVDSIQPIWAQRHG